MFGGVDIKPQIAALRQGCEVLIATPGRLLDHMGQKTVTLAQAELLVLDEADRMLDMGFLPDIQRIIHALPARRQNLMFSATFSGEIRKLAETFLTMVRSRSRANTAENVDSWCFACDLDQARRVASPTAASRSSVPT